jgi:malonate-semialdehyde dehydrogenase (acetylating)/methylmalonate-semialdehyde dehydrogenase
MRPRDFSWARTIVDQVQRDMTIAREEVFGPVLNVMRMEDLDHAIEQATFRVRQWAAIFTNSGKAAREFKHRVKAA